MSTTQHDAGPSTELVDVARNLYMTLMACREPVLLASSARLLAGQGLEAQRLAELAERVDGALAEAGDYLERVPS